MAGRTLLLSLALFLFAFPAHAFDFGLVKDDVVPTGIGCYDIKTADLNGDGRADAVAALNDAHGISIVFGAPGGLGATTFYPSGQAVAVDLADYDGNGSIDILETDWQETTFRLWINQGNGTFVAQPGSYALPGNPRDVASGDWNGDGRRDIALVTSNGYVSFLLGQVGGGFGSVSSYSIGAAMKAVAAGDLDQDGDLDLVVIDSDAREMIRLRNDGGALPFTIVSRTHFTGAPSDVALADFDGDGVLDAAVSQENGFVRVVKGGAADFPGLATTSAIGTLSQSVQVADFDGENGPDLLVSNWNQSTAQVLRNLGGLQFGASVSAGTGTNPRSAAPGDFDGDGRIDVVTGEFAAASVTLLRNAPPNPHLAYEPQILDFSTGFQGYPETHQIQLQNLGITTLVVTPQAVVGDQFAFVSPSAISVAPGNSMPLGIVCLRTALGDATGRVDLASNDPSAPAFSIDLLASTSPSLPQVAYESVPLDFGTDYVGNEDVLSLEFSNVGHASLTVLPGAIDGSEFDYPGAHSAITIPVGGSGSLSIRYLRTTEGGAAGTLHLTTNDPAAPEIAIELEGFAGPPPIAGFSAPEPITVFAGTEAKTAVVVRNLGVTPLHVTVPESAGDLAEVSPFDVGPTQTDFYRQEPSGAVWNIDWEGRVTSGASGEYAGGMDESNFLTQTQGVLGLGGRELRLGPVPIALGLLVTRKIFIPEGGGWVRYIDVAENPNETSRTATFDLVDNIGYTPQGILRTSNGNSTFELVDDWIVVPAADDRRTVGRVFRSVSAANVPVLATFFASPGVPGSFTRTKYVTTLGPHERACVIQWAVQGADVNETMAAVEALRQDPTPGLQFADAIDRGTAWNLVDGGSPFRPTHGDYVIAPGDSVEVSVIYGAESATHDADLTATLRITTDDPAHRVLSVPLAFSVGNGQFVGAPDGPAVAAIELTGFRPNPTRMSGTSRVAFRLASTEPATLTLYDVRGRVLARQALAAPQPGPGSIALGGASLKPGVVWMRLEQGGKVATGKGIVLP